MLYHYQPHYNYDSVEGSFQRKRYTIPTPLAHDKRPLLLAEPRPLYRQYYFHSKPHRAACCILSYHTPRRKQKNTSRWRVLVAFLSQSVISDSSYTARFIGVILRFGGCTRVERVRSAYFFCGMLRLMRSNREKHGIVNYLKTEWPRRKGNSH